MMLTEKISTTDAEWEERPTDSPTRDGGLLQGIGSSDEVRDLFTTTFNHTLVQAPRTESVRPQQLKEVTLKVDSSASRPCGSCWPTRSCVAVVKFWLADSILRCAGGVHCSC